MRDLARHDLLTVAPDAWAAALTARPDLHEIPHLADWAERGWPVIVRRPVPGEEAGPIPVGLPLPPSLGKRRICLALAPAAVTSRPGVTLAEARDVAPSSWHPSVDALVTLGSNHGLVPRVFGGLLWQFLTALDYLTPTSDLDLLWPGPVGVTLLNGLAEVEAHAPMCLDGEIVLPDGFGLNWREVLAAGPGETILAKGLDRLELRSVPACMSPAMA